MKFNPTKSREELIANVGKIFDQLIFTRMIIMKNTLKAVDARKFVSETDETRNLINQLDRSVSSIRESNVWSVVGTIWVRKTEDGTFTISPGEDNSFNAFINYIETIFLEDKVFVNERTVVVWALALAHAYTEIGLSVTLKTEGLNPIAMDGLREAAEAIYEVMMRREEQHRLEQLKEALR